LHRSRRQSRLLILAAGATLWAAAALGQTASISISPLRIEAQVIPGVEKTVSFELFTPASPDGEAGRVVLNLTDWTIREDGSADYTEPGTQPYSASAWVRFSPAAVTLRAGQRQLVRVTILAPPHTAPGVYRTALFVQGRPPAAPKTGEVSGFFLRVRYAFTLYVVIQPVAARAELTDLAVTATASQLQMMPTLVNTGTAHTRPTVQWTVKTAAGAIAAEGGEELRVLLPSATLRQSIARTLALAPGSYDASIVVDFRDGRPLQAMTRPFTVAPPRPF
jgi:P pilus assembly chaperone PapD